MSTALVVVGALVVLLVLVDIFFTVLFPSSGRGPLRKPVTSALWRLFQAGGRLAGASRRQHILAYSGPTVITITLLTWILLLTVGWAMIAQPALGRAISNSGGHTDTGWGSALYYSASVLTTLGPGNLSVTGSAYRLLEDVEGGIGLVTVTMVITRRCRRIAPTRCCATSTFVRPVTPYREYSCWP